MAEQEIALHVEKGEETKEDDGAGGRMLFYVCCGVCVLVFCTTEVVLVCGIVKR